MKEIEDGLHRLHSEAREQAAASNSAADAATSDAELSRAASKPDVNTAFAKIDQVHAGSPAGEAVIIIFCCFTFVFFVHVTCDKFVDKIHLICRISAQVIVIA